MTTKKQFKFVSKQLADNQAYMKVEVGATISYDLGFREVVVFERIIQLYYVNGLVDDGMIVEILKVLLYTIDNEAETDKLVSIIKNRHVNQQVGLKIEL